MKGKGGGRRLSGWCIDLLASLRTIRGTFLWHPYDAIVSGGRREKEGGGKRKLRGRTREAIVVRYQADESLRRRGVKRSAGIRLRW